MNNARVPQLKRSFCAAYTFHVPHSRALFDQTQRLPFHPPEARYITYEKNTHHVLLRLVLRFSYRSRCATYLCWQSFALAIVGAEYLAGLVPVGTHDWHKFVPPVDLAAMLHARGFSRESLDTCGLMYDPLTGRWSENADDLDVNYIMTSLRSTST